MTKQPASTSLKRVRIGYRNKPKGPDWSVDGDYLVWNRGDGIRIHTDDAGCDPHYLLNRKYASHQRKAIEGAVVKIKKRIEKGIIEIGISEQERAFILDTAQDWKISDYFEIGVYVLASNQFSDAQKMFFLERISDLQGFKYGRDVSRLLSCLRWRCENFVDRWNEYVNLTRDVFAYDGNFPAIEIDNEIVQRLPDKVNLYRGFNVPHSKSIRHAKEWLRQKYGANPYYSLSSMTALSFACRQKASLGRRIIQYGDLKKSEMEIFEGKIAVAKYSVPRTKIISYNHTLKRLESECICNTKDVLLLNYTFCGISEFWKWKKWYVDVQSRLHPLNSNERLEIAKEVAFTSV